jgi:hypothetical protein
MGAVVPTKWNDRVQGPSLKFRLRFEMNWFIHREKRFDKELELLRSQGDKAQVAAKRAEEIINKLTQKGWTDLKHVAKLSDHGEHRVDGCIKYDLGGGFRLVCFKRGDHLYFSYVGTHDDCHRWLHRNRSLHNQVGKREADTTVVKKMGPETTRIVKEQTEEPDYDDLLMAKMDEKALRKVFKGLVCRQQRG